MKIKEEKLERLYNHCIAELNQINLDLREYGINKIKLEIKKGRNSTYGMCVKAEPDKSTQYYERGKKKYLIYQKHTIQISDWVLDLKDEIIKNTIMHEIIHCFPGAGNHGKVFKKLAQVVNYELGYNISRVGNKKRDFTQSGINYDKFQSQERYKYILECLNCHEQFKRKRFNIKHIDKYLCPFCKSKLKIQII